MTRREFNVAVISFEYEHHVDAIKKTVDKFIDDGFIL